MRITGRARKILETASLSLILLAVNSFFPRDPGFTAIHFLPYGTAAVFMSVYYGRRYGLLSLACSVFCLIVPMPPILYLLYHIQYRDFQWKNLLLILYAPIPITLALMYLFGIVRLGYTHSIENLKTHLKTVVKQNHRLGGIVDAQTSINRELEERVSKQQESITHLYSQVQKMNSLDHQEVLRILLDTVQTFTAVKKASVWRVDEETRRYLTPERTLGWDENQDQTEMIPLDGSIEGWVFRNNSIFSVRMLLQYEHLTKLCTGKNLLTLPISVGHQVWGVLNIEDMPFEKYNLYTEQLLIIILSLAQTSLESALEYEYLIQKEEMDSLTGLPLFSQLYRYLEEKNRAAEAGRGSLSLVVLEITNMDRIVGDKGHPAAAELLKAVLERLEHLAGNRAKGFRYKNNNQFAFVFTDLDYDGLGMFCMEALSSVSEGGFVVAGSPEAVEMILGYALAGESTEEVKELFEEAERLLEMQKV
ncbi:MAG: diguanylate cyclase [Spirochaetales bacterium]|nr:diguanylate cyclase [Spirochaetales bacterium]